MTCRSRRACSTRRPAGCRCSGACTGSRRKASNACRSSSRGSSATDPAATACSQTMRVPGFLNWKYAPPVVVTGDYGDTSAVFEPSDFPIPADPHAGHSDGRRHANRRTTGGRRH